MGEGMGWALFSGAGKQKDGEIAGKKLSTEIHYFPPYLMKKQEIAKKLSSLMGFQIQE